MSAPSNVKNSKTSNKDKNTEDVIELEKKLGLLTKENLELSMALKRVTNQTIIMNQGNQIQGAEFSREVSKVHSQIEELELRNAAQTQRIEELSKENSNHEIESGCLKYRLQKITREFEDYKSTHEKQFEEYQKHMSSEIARYEAIVNEYQSTINERTQYLKQVERLKKELQTEEETRKEMAADKDRDKVQTIDCLKKEMVEQCKEMEVNLLTMKREKMETHTRLTVLQNHQLLEELEYQSKQTEKVLKKNEELESAKKHLTKQLEVQKEIERQLATRSSVSKNIIKNLNQKNTELERTLLQQREELKSLQASHGQSSNGIGCDLGAADQIDTSQHGYLYKINKEMNIMREQLSNYRAQCRKSRDQLSELKNKYEERNSALRFYENSESSLRAIMIRFLDECLNGEIKGEEGELEFDLRSLKAKHIDKWTIDEIELTVRLLLTYLKPNFNLQSVGSAYLRYSNSEKQKQSKNEFDEEVDKLRQQNQQRKIQALPIISQSKSCQKRSLHKSRNLSEHLHYSDTKLIDYKGNKETSTKKRSAEKQLKTHSLHCSRSQGQIGQQTESKNLEGILKNNNSGGECALRFKKSSSKLVRTSMRQWGKKVKMHSKCSFLEQSAKAIRRQRSEEEKRKQNIQRSSPLKNKFLKRLA